MTEFKGQPIETDSNDAERDEAVKRLRALVHQLKISVKIAATDMPDGKIYLGIMAKKPDGSGRVFTSFESPDFVKDLALILNRTEEPTDLDVAAARLMGMLG